jgi:hypothetical protein
MLPELAREARCRTERIKTESSLMECEHRLTDERVQACLAAISRVTVNNTALNSLIQGGD